MLGSVGDDRSKDSTYNITFRKGMYQVNWMLTGADLGNSLIRFQKNEKTGEDLPIFHTKDVLTLLRRLPTKLESDVSED